MIDVLSNHDRKVKGIRSKEKSLWITNKMKLGLVEIVSPLLFLSISGIPFYYYSFQAEFPWPGYGKSHQITAQTSDPDCYFLSHSAKFCHEEPDRRIATFRRAGVQETDISRHHGGTVDCVPLNPSNTTAVWYLGGLERGGGELNWTSLNWRNFLSV